MKVKNLIEELQKANPERDIYLSNDSEGNTIYSIDEVAESEGDGETLLVIYPTNEVIRY